MARVVVVGAGLDGLAAGTRLARAGHRVVVLERSPAPGGAAAGEAFFPGYRHAGLRHDARAFPASLARALGFGARLVRQPEPPPWIATPDGLVRPDQADPAGWAGLQQVVALARKAALPRLAVLPPRTDGDAPVLPLARMALGLRRLGADPLLELLRVGPMAVDDLLAEHLADPWLRAGVALDGLHGTWMGPRSPTSAATWLLAQACAGEAVVGGPAALVREAAHALKGAGGLLRCDAEVARIRIEGGRAAGVELAGGERIDADAVLLACDPKRGLLELVDPLELPPTAERDLGEVRARGLAAKVHLALSAPPPWPDGRLVVAGRPDDLERAFDQVKYGEFAERLPLDVRAYAGSDLAPEGHAVLSVLVHGVPFHLRGGWTAAARERLARAVLGTLEAAVPGLGASVVGEEVLTPADLAARLALPEGHLWHGELALDQLFVARPSLGLSRYQVDIEGLWLGSVGVHPGVANSGMSGWLAAGAMDGKGR